ncbi:MAG: hypothetical protein HY918_02335 [Candidatus Doudnabacteria bacterium]|nr:hypothetical protein [Candidatus Doudnabacteria bacterium]
MITMKKFFSIFVLAALAAFSANAQNNTAPVPVAQTSMICDPTKDVVLVGEWNSGEARSICHSYAGNIEVVNRVWAPSAQQILPLDGAYNFLTYSTSGRVRWHTPEQTWQWLLPANGRLRNENRFGFTLTDRWEREKLGLGLWAGGFYTADSMPMTNLDYCTMSSANPQDIIVCADSNNKRFTMSRPSDFAGHREELSVNLDQYPVGTAAIGGKLYLLLANEFTYPPCNDPVCSPVAPTSVVPGKLVEVSFDYGQSEVSQKVVLDGINVDPVTNLNRVAAGKDDIYWVAGQHTIVRYNPSTRGKVKVYYEAGEQTMLAGLAVVPAKQ